MGPRAVGELVSRAAAQHPDRVAVKVPDGPQRTYRELDERTGRLAGALLAAGLEHGDRVAAWMADSIEYVELYVAAAKAGLVVAPINARLAAPEADFILADSGARLLVSTPDMADRVARLEHAGHDAVVADERWESWCARGDAEIVRGPGTNDLYILGYTSGTTGRPKGAMLTHRSVLSIARQNAVSYRLSPHATLALTGSMSFVAIVPAHVICSLYLAGTLILMGRWQPEQLIDTVRRDRVHFAYVPSPLIADVAEAFAAEPAAVASLTSVLHAGARARPDHLHALHAAVGARLVEGWGMTEHSGGLATATVPADFAGAALEDPIFSSVGRAAIDVQLKVVDDTGDDLPWDGESIGELCVRSPALMDGYWQNPEATAAGLVDGWYRSGDLGAIDPGGLVTIAERRTDLIISGGANVYPSEVERCIAEMELVADVAVVGVADERWGQAVAAVVVLDDAAGGMNEAAVIDHCRERLASFKKPRHVLFFDELPRNAALKVARGRLRDDVAARLGSPSALRG